MFCIIAAKLPKSCSLTVWIEVFGKQMLKVDRWQRTCLKLYSGPAHFLGTRIREFCDYYKQSDKRSVAFNAAVKEIRSYDVHIYLDDAKDVVTLNNQFADLTDGTNYLQQTVLDAKSK